MAFETLETLELNKVLERVAEYACLNRTRNIIRALVPSYDFKQAAELLDTTQEADKLLYSYGAGGIEVFEIEDEVLNRAATGAALSMSELLKTAGLLRSSRVLRTSVCKDEYGDIINLRAHCRNIYTDEVLEKDIRDKILSAEDISDNASERLSVIRRQIKSINAKIREKLSSYLSKYAKYIQDSIITQRSGRFVIPVKTEYKSAVKGFIHDQSASGATVFIEPEYVFELNNELKSAIIYEQTEIQRILLELSNRVGNISLVLKENINLICQVDCFYAKAVYAYKTKSIKPGVNKNGIISISKGRHPLIPSEKVVPLSFETGKDFKFLLISGANTGGKTVTLKLAGLFVLMAACGLFVPCASADLAVFKDVYCDIGDMQSIENELSTFSSHLRNLKNITDNAGENSLVLIDELGDGTDPEEGQALALAVLKFLLKTKCTGIITTHFSLLKDFALTQPDIINSSMEFDRSSLTPLYKISIGLPGSSNALLIAQRLGLNKDIVTNAYSLLSPDKKIFDNIVNQAQQKRMETENKLAEIELIKADMQALKDKSEKEYEKLVKERERIALSSRMEIKKLVGVKIEQAEELLEQITQIAAKSDLSTGDVITAKTLLNKLDAQRYLHETNQDINPNIQKADLSLLKNGDLVFVKSLNKNCTILKILPLKNQAEVASGAIKYTCSVDELYRPVHNNAAKNKKAHKFAAAVTDLNQVKQTADFDGQSPAIEINLIGKNVAEAEIDCEAFLDRAVRTGLSEVKIIHGAGTGRLREGIRSYLKSHPFVESFRPGKYGEGENGITVVYLK